MSDPIQLHNDPSAMDSLSASAVVPIIFVPGVMGSRLDIPTAGLVWDPDRAGKMTAWIPTLVGFGEDAQRRTNRAALSPNASSATTLTTLAPSAKESLNNWLDTNPWAYTESNGDPYTYFGTTRNWGSVCWGFYGAILMYLESAFNRTTSCPVFACGYDWRSSNADSGAFLSAFITNVLAQYPSAQDVIVVTHSMGGLVLRGAIQANGSIASQIRGVVHGAQPTNGAVVCYRRFFTGCTAVLDASSWRAVADHILNRIMGGEPWEYAFNLSGCPGPLQLLPNHIYQQNNSPDDGHWLLWTDGTADLGDIYSIYTRYNWPGLVGPVDCAQSKQATDDDISSNAIVSEFLVNIVNAQAFHSAVATTAHPNTYAIFSTGLATDVGVFFGPYPTDAQGWAVPGSVLGFSGDLTVTKERRGDGTVPAVSGSCPALALGEAPVYVSGKEHSAVYQDAHFKNQAQRYILQLLALPPSGTLPGTRTFQTSEAVPYSDG